MLKPMGKEILTMLRSKNVFISKPVTSHKLHDVKMHLISNNARPVDYNVNIRTMAQGRTRDSCVRCLKWLIL